jgi:hypothetical protein
MRKYWIAVASAEHVKIGQSAGFMQVCHGKAAPLKRIKSKDLVVYYSPTYTFKGKDICQCFTARGEVKDGEPYAFDMGNGFIPYRRDVFWFDSKQAEIHPLLNQLSFAKDGQHWGYQFRFGLFEITELDMQIIKEAMTASI